jgi:hypothetical protein
VKCADFDSLVPNNQLIRCKKLNVLCEDLKEFVVRICKNVADVSVRTYEVGTKGL